MSREPSLSWEKELTSAKKIWWDIFWTFFKIGAFTIGGGYVMLPLIEQAIVNKKKWIKSEQFLDLIAIAQSAPGVMAINSAVAVGYQIAGLSGAVVASLGAALPSFFIIIIVATFFLNFQSNPYVAAFFQGARPAVVILMALAAYDMGKKVVKDKTGLAIIGVGLVSIILLHIHPVIAIISAGVFGAVYYKKIKS